MFSCAETTQGMGGSVEPTIPEYSPCLSFTAFAVRSMIHDSLKLPS
jgi:hypothetical protein